MSRQKCPYKNDIETHKKPKSKEKIELKFAIQQKQVKAKLSAEKADIWSRQIHIFTNVTLLLLRTFLIYFVCIPSFKLINSSSLPRKNMVTFL